MIPLFSREIRPVPDLKHLPLLALMLLPMSAFSQDTLPVWEVGVAAFALSGQDYPASDRANDRVLAAPFGIYRGERFRLGEGGLQAIAVENPRYRFDLSVSGSLDANSEGNPLREGMPDLDFLFEIGPQLIVTLDRRRLADQSEAVTDLSIQLRGAFSTDFGYVDALGPVASISLEYDRDDMLDGRFGLGVELNAVFTDEKMQDLFYQVDPEFVTANRAQYDARSGYLGSDITFSGGYHVTPDFSVFAGVSFNSFAGAANEDSPLFETDSTVNSWLGVVWTLRKSKSSITVLH